MVYTLQFITLNMFRKLLGNNTCTNIIFQLDYHLWKIYQEGSKAQVAYASSDEQKVMLPDILIIHHILQKSWSDFSLSVMIRTGVLYHGTLIDSSVIHGGLNHGQMVGMIQAPMCQLVSRDPAEIFRRQVTVASPSLYGRSS